jgi:arsenate reductase
MSWTIYHHPRCSKSRETLKLLQDKGIEPTVVEYVKNPPSEKTLCTILDLLGVSATDLIRTKEKVIEEQQLDVSTPSKALQAMLDHPILMERPIVVKDNQEAVIGRPPQNVLGLL